MATKPKVDPNDFIWAFEIVAYDYKGHVVAFGCGATDEESKLDMVQGMRQADAKRIYRVESQRVLVGARSSVSAASAPKPSASSQRLERRLALA